MPPRFIDGPELARVLPMARAIAELEAAFAGRLPEAPPRSHLDVGGGNLLLMPAWSDEAAGVKLVTVAPDNPSRGLPLIHGTYVLFDKPALEPVALFDAAALTGLRTAAVSAVATRHLARSEAAALVIFGAGTQAHSHLEAMVCVRPIRRVTIVSRSEGPARALAERARERGLEAELGTPDAVSGADVVCTCTTSDKALFDGALLAPGAHVNAVGSYKPTARELDDAAMRNAVIVTDVELATTESGDLAEPLATGVIVEEDIALLADVVKQRSGRRSATDVTVFKSVGAAFEDLVVAAAATRL